MGYQAKVLKVRTMTTHFYSDGSNHFKVWQADAGGWWVERETADGFNVAGDGMTYVDTVQEAEQFMTERAAAWRTEKAGV